MVTGKPDEKQRKAVDSRFGRLAESETENTCGDYLRQPIGSQRTIIGVELQKNSDLAF